MLYGCSWHVKSPIILGCINKLSITCYVWNLMFSVQMGDKRKTGKGEASCIFYFLTIVKTSLFLFPAWTLQADRGNFRNGWDIRRSEPARAWPTASMSEEFLFWESGVCDVPWLSADVTVGASQLASNLIFLLGFLRQNTSKFHPMWPFSFCTSAFLFLS